MDFVKIPGLRRCRHQTPRELKTEIDNLTVKHFESYLFGATVVNYSEAPLRRPLNTLSITHMISLLCAQGVQESRFVRSAPFTT